MVVKALLLGLIAVWCQLDYQLGTLYTFRPITVGPLVGLVLGNFQQGIIIGATLEMLFMGAISVGAYIPPDVKVGAILGTAFAITSGQGPEAAVTIAMPIALISVAIGNILDAFTPICLKIADDGAANGDVGKIKLTHFLLGIFGVILKFCLVFFAYWLGADAVSSLLDSIPAVITDGMAVAAGMLPTLGFAMLMRMTLNKKNIVYYFLGFLISAYLKVPVLGVALFGIIIIIEKYGLLGKKKETVAVAAGGDNNDEEF